MKERRTSIESMGTGQTLTHERKELTFTVRRWEQSQTCIHSWRIHHHPSKSYHLLAIESGIQGSTNTIENLHFRRKNVEDCVEGLLHLGDSNIRGHKQLSLWVVELESCVNSAHLRWKQSISRENRCTFRVKCRKTLGTKEWMNRYVLWEKETVSSSKFHRKADVFAVLLGKRTKVKDSVFVNNEE